jgi:hypothetical protein
MAWSSSGTLRRFSRLTCNLDASRHGHGIGDINQNINIIITLLSGLMTRVSREPTRSFASGQLNLSMFQGDLDAIILLVAKRLVHLGGVAGGRKKGTGVINSRVNRADGKKELEAQRRSLQCGKP